MSIRGGEKRLVQQQPDAPAVFADHRKARLQRGPRIAQDQLFPVKGHVTHGFIEAHDAVGHADLALPGQAADAQDFDLRDRFPEGFEVIVASEIIEHLVNPGGFLRSLKKHLAPGGIIILSTPHAYGLVYFAEVLLLGEEKINDDHTMTFSKKNLDHLLDKCGLVPVEFHYLNQMGLWRTEWWAKALCRLWWGFQYLVAFVRPSLSRELLYVIGPKPEDSPC